MATLGIDFGTSNTGAGVVRGGRPVALPLEPGAQTLPSAVFIDFADRRFVYGTQAAQAMMDGQEGRFLRALKSVLGTPLAREPRQFLNERLTLVDIIARFLAEIRTRAERATGTRYDTALSGRPVRFHSTDSARDAQAQADLAEAYGLAGFRAVDFLPEPEAAARAVAGEGRLLIVDIGGGTSDFTLCERAGGRTKVLASRGIRIGGTDFDRALSLAFVMPHLGYGAQIKDPFGAQAHTVPRGFYHDLASWEKIAFVYDPGLLRDVKRWVRLAGEPALFQRLAEVLEAHLGHDVAYAVEAAKISANDADTSDIALGLVEKGLTVPLHRAAMQAELLGWADQIGDCALDTLTAAGCRPDDLGTVVFVGGSSLMGVVRTAIGSRFPKARQEDAEVFTAVVHGLALAAA